MTREPTRGKTTSRPRINRPGRGRYVPRRKVCFFCIDYKNPDKLRGYMSDRGKIEPRRRTGTCAKHQRALATAIKRARHLALMPYVADHIFPTQPIITSVAPLNPPTT
jgi:small subunit ribosomal protein S18